MSAVIQKAVPVLGTICIHASSNDIYICVKSINTRKTTLYEGKDTECNMFAVVCGSSPFSCCTGFQDINVCVGVYIHAYLLLVLC